MIEGLLQMSEMGVVVILAVLLLRLCLRRVPKNFSYALWAIVLFRLLCPVSVTLPVSVFNLFAGVGTETDVTGQIPPRSEPGNGQAALIEQKSRQQTTKKQSPVNGRPGRFGSLAGTGRRWLEGDLYGSMARRSSRDDCLRRI